MDVLYAATDAEALLNAEELGSEFDVEVWPGARRVGTIEAD